MKNSTAIWCISFFLVGFGVTGSILTDVPEYGTISLVGVAGLIAHYMTRAIEDNGNPPQK